MSRAFFATPVAHTSTGAIPLYNRALKLGPDTPTLREDFGVAYRQQSDLQDAIGQFRLGLALEPEQRPSSL